MRLLATLLLSTPLLSALLLLLLLSRLDGEAPEGRRDPGTEAESPEGEGA